MVYAFCSFQNSRLRVPSDSDLRELGQVLWSWELCDGCRFGRRCATSNCPSQRIKRLGRFFDYYKDVTGSYESEVEPGKVPALKTHQDLFDIVMKLKSNPDLTRAQLTNDIFNYLGGQKQTSIVDQDAAVNLAVRVMLMVNCSAQRQSPGLLEHGIYHSRWNSDVAFSQFIGDIFPMTDHPGLNNNSARPFLDMRAALTARKLKKRAGLKFRPTDDLRSHLKLDQRNGVVEIYHHTAFLKEHLRITKNEGKIGICDGLKL